MAVLSGALAGFYRLRILHISDLHERGPRDQERWRYRRMFDRAWENNLAELLQDGPIDLICFTGDIADWGLAAEYDAATDFVQNLWERLRVPPERLFVIPGNHDIARPVERDVWTSLRMSLSSVDALDFSRWVNSAGPAPPGIDNSWRDRILARESAYRTWVGEELKRPELSPPGLGYRASVRVDGWPFDIHLLGLDTAWLCGDDSDAGSLLLTENQLMRLATGDDGRPLNGLRLALMHHPFNQLADASQSRRRAAEYADLILRGHLHETEIETWADPDRKVRQAAAGCLYEGHRADQYSNACQVITIELSAAGRPQRIDLRFRAWSSRGGHWFDDDSLYRESKQGRLTWIVEQAPVFEAEKNPYSPWTPDPARFVQRQRLLRRLESALEEARSVSIVGDWRSGKTMILKAWHERVKNRGRPAALLNGEGKEGKSAGAFVQAVTGLTVPDDADGAADRLQMWAASVARPGLPPLLLVDEVDGLIERFDIRFFERLRGMLGRIILVFATRQELGRLFVNQGRGSPLDNRFETQWVGLLEEDEAEDLIGRGKHRFGPAGEDLLRRWAGRHPFYLELLGYYLCSGSSEDALDQFRTQTSARLRELWSVMNDAERSALQDCVGGGIPCQKLSLRRRGLVTEKGVVFGEALSSWLREEL